MRNLFGEGRHPDTERLEYAALDAGNNIKQAKRASPHPLGRVFAMYKGNQPEFIQETARCYIAFNLQRGEHWWAPVPTEERARIRTALANGQFLCEHGGAPLDDRERDSFMAKAIRQQTTCVAGYDLIFTGSRAPQPCFAGISRWAGSDQVSRGNPVSACARSSNLEGTIKTPRIDTSYATAAALDVPLADLVAVL